MPAYFNWRKSWLKLLGNKIFYFLIMKNYEKLWKVLYLINTINKWLPDYTFYTLYSFWKIKNCCSSEIFSLQQSLKKLKDVTWRSKLKQILITAQWNCWSQYTKDVILRWKKNCSKFFAILCHMRQISFKLKWFKVLG